jgi:hypothetical protein
LCTPNGSSRCCASSHRAINTRLIQQTHVKRKDGNTKPEGKVDSTPWNGVELLYGKLSGSFPESAKKARGRQRAHGIRSWPAAEQQAADLLVSTAG